MDRWCIILCLLPLMAVAANDGPGWTTNVWPAYTVQREGRQHAEDCYEMSLERFYAAEAAADNGPGGPTFTAPTAPTWWRFQRANLQNAKTSLAAYIPYFARTQTNYVQWLEANEDISGDLNNTEIPRWTNVTDFLTFAGLPTNYLTYTPWRALNGLGPPGYTNDSDYATLGHAYGFENADTVSGGTNFPAGRTTWYTTDYGWQGLYDMAPHLVHTPNINEYSISAGQKGAWGGAWYATSSDTNTYTYSSAHVDQSTWSAAKTAAENAVTNIASSTTFWPYGPWAYTSGRYRSSVPDYYGRISAIKTRWRMSIKGDTNGPACTYALHFYDSTNLPSTLTYWDETMIYDYNGVTAFAADAWSALTDTNEYGCGAGYVLSDVIGIPPAWPTWCATPTDGDSDADTQRGFVMMGGSKQSFWPTMNRGDKVLPVMFWTPHTSGFEYY